MRFTRILLLVSLIALVAAPIALALRFTDESFNPPVGETGKIYSWSFTGAGGCGPAWSVALPTAGVAAQGAGAVPYGD